MNDKYLDFAKDIAIEAGKIIKKNFKPGMERELKPEAWNSPVTKTDLEINSLVIESVKKKFPDHSVLAEEQSNEFDSEYVWVCDPLDGTIPFTHGLPISVFSIALIHKGESILGLINDPYQDRLLIAEKGKGATMNGKKIKVSNHKTIKGAYFDLNVWVDSPFKLLPLENTLGSEGTTMKICSVGYSGMLVALGELEATIYCYEYPWDGAAIKVIAEEAGGKVTDVFGNEQRWDKPIKGFIASNGYLHKEIVDQIKNVL